MASVSLPIPDEITISCLALVQRCDYPTLSLVSSRFRDLIASPKLYAARSIQSCIEPVLYAFVGFYPSIETPSCYILHRKPYRNTISMKLRKIDSIPPIPWGSAVVKIGSEIYVIGGCVGDNRTTDFTLIDCKSHTYRSLPKMEVARCRAAAGAIDGKIYVIGGCEMRSTSWIEYFDLKEQVWIGSVWSTSVLPSVSREFLTYAVMEEKIHMLDEKNICYAYEPNASKWEILGGELSLLWQESSCVIDDLLFSINPQLPQVQLIAEPIIVYDPKKDMIWRPLKGLQGFPANIRIKESKMASFGGKLVVLGSDASRFSKYDGKKEIWCVEIALERRKGGEIWGKVESVEVVLTALKSPSIEICPTVTV